MALNDCEREFLKYLQNKQKEFKKQKQEATPLSEVPPTAAPEAVVSVAPKKRGRKPKPEQN